MVKPLIIMTTFNRKQETAETLDALDATTNLAAVEVVIVDNASTDGTAALVLDWSQGRADHEVVAYALKQNIGCPKALNFALSRHRKPGQPVVKIDNDVRLLTAGWVVGVPWLVSCYRNELYREVAMVGAYYDGVLDDRLIWSEKWEGVPVHYINPVIGHTVWHTGRFMDAVGYFDVLADDHLYGFEDLIMSHKARELGWDMLVWEGWQIENLQRHNSLGDGREEHVRVMRPHYNERVNALRAGETIWTGADGRPAQERKEVISDNTTDRV